MLAEQREQLGLHAAGDDVVVALVVGGFGIPLLFAGGEKVAEEGGGEVGDAVGVAVAGLDLCVKGGGDFGGRCCLVGGVGIDGADLVGCQPWKH